MKESKFQKDLKKKIKEMFPGAIVTKLDSSQIQGIPDLLILWKQRWATLECKKSKEAFFASNIPNQHRYVSKMNKMSFSSFIYPENEEEVLDALERSCKGDA